jgi:sugar lactone lactonase YvrE
MGRLYVGAALLLLNIHSQCETTAVEEFTHLRQQAHAAQVASDNRAYLQAVLKIQRLLNGAPDAVELVAKAYAAAGDSGHALMSLREFAELGQTDDDLLAGKDQAFAALHNLPEYHSILQRLTANKKAVAASEVAFTLTDPGILAEDIDFDPQTKSFLISSVLERKIVRVAPDGSVADFALSPSHWPMLALKVDAARKLVWATEVAMNGYALAPKADWGRSAVLCFDSQTGALQSRIEGPVKAALGDMVLTQGGDPIVSDGDGGGVYRLTGGHLTLINGKDFISPQTPTMFPDGNHVAIPDYARGVGILDLHDEHVTWINQRGGTKVALNAIDGLYYDHGALLLTQNGSSPERVVRVQLDKSQTKTRSEQILEKATPTLGDPTHGVVVGDWFYYIANSGWDMLDEHGSLKAGAQPTPARVMRFRLR